MNFLKNVKYSIISVFWPKPIIAILLSILFSPVQAQSQSYTLGAGDLIYISVYGEDDLSFEFKLSDSGVITFPFIGEIQVTGNTATSVEGIISSRLISQEFLIRPEVTVNILEYRPFYISGEVASPGSYPFESGLTLRKAISLAGGFTERASRTKISIITNNPDQNSKIPTDFLLETPINPDDIITVNQRFF